ncbi:MAG: T9SS C-terminal target domain-containing protein [Ignavibacteriae bacterium]|nr:MAG: T9SS C-terminal target domain-containing protein [Ignavibacteriota bacterium]
MKYLILLLTFLLPSYIFSQVTFTDVSVSLGVNDGGAGQGAVFLDVDGDGWLDLYNANNNTNCRLWKNNAGTSFTDIGAAWGVSGTFPTRGCSAADFDNDGNIDIMVGNYNAVLILYKNTGTAYTNFTTNAGVNFMGYGGSINWIDYNSDGKVDAVFANDGIPYHYNYLFKNENLLSFTNVAYSSGLTDSLSTLCLGSADYDNDGDMDLFCGSQTNTPNPVTGRLYVNNGNGTFSDVTTSSQLTTYAYTWSCDWGDFDNDGDMDLYLGASNAPNLLYQNNGNSTFTEVSMQYGVNDPSQSYSCGWLDFDNDGDLDLYVANGQPTPDKLYRNDGSTFTDVASTVGTNDIRHSACISLGDYNNDGFVDIYLVNNGTENRLYKSNAGNSNKWVELRLRGINSNRSAIGARVKVKAGSLSMIREVQGGSGGKGQNSLPVEFGLGSASIIDSVIIRWPSGLVQRFANVAPNTIYNAIEGQPLGITNNNTGIPESYALHQNYPNPFNPATIINYQLAKSNDVKLVVYDVMGKEIAVLVNQKQNAGTYEVEWDASNYPSGIYFYTIQAGDYKQTRKMVLLK